MSIEELPDGWSEDQIQAVIKHYDNQSEDEEFEEIETALGAENITMMAVPTDRVLEVQALLARGASS